MSFGDYYPPGVNGSEWQIAGPQDEYEEERVVEHECDEDTYEEVFTGKVTVSITYWDRYTPLSISFECPQCGEEYEGEEEIDE